MKKWLVALLVAALVMLPATAMAKGLSKKLFTSAKEAVSLISYGEYKKALKNLGLANGKQDVKKLSNLAEEGLSSAFYGDVQTDVAVGYATSKGYKLAVPVLEPDSWDVEAFVVLTKDGESAGGYTSMSWGDVLTELGESDDVVWNKEYDPDAPLIIIDD